MGCSCGSGGRCRFHGIRHRAWKERSNVFETQCFLSGMGILIFCIWYLALRRAGKWDIYYTVKYLSCISREWETPERNIHIHIHMRVREKCILIVISPLHYGVLYLKSLMVRSREDREGTCVFSEWKAGGICALQTGSTIHCRSHGVITRWVK